MRSRRGPCHLRRVGIDSRRLQPRRPFPALLSCVIALRLCSLFLVGRKQSSPARFTVFVGGPDPEIKYVAKVDVLMLWHKHALRRAPPHHHHLVLARPNRVTNSPFPRASHHSRMPRPGNVPQQQHRKNATKNPPRESDGVQPGGAGRVCGVQRRPFRRLVAVLQKEKRAGEVIGAQRRYSNRRGKVLGLCIFVRHSGVCFFGPVDHIRHTWLYLDRYRHR